MSRSSCVVASGGEEALRLLCSRAGFERQDAGNKQGMAWVGGACDSSIELRVIWGASEVRSGEGAARTGQ